MGIKSTRTLSRSEALEMYNTLLEELYGIKGPTNRELADLLDRLQDMKCERDGVPSFDNYWVVDDAEYDQMKRDWEKY